MEAVENALLDEVKNAQADVNIDAPMVSDLKDAEHYVLNLASNVWPRVPQT